MSVAKIITLTNKGNAAGPYYEVSCSNDCVTYGSCVTTGSVYLPTIGSTATINIYDTTTCIKLVNYNTECNNSQVQTFAASGSTTSTTSTSTTTTTAAPVYRFYNLNINSGSLMGNGNSVGYIDQFGNSRTLNLLTFGNRFYMYAKSGSFNFTNVGASYILTDLGASTTSTLSYRVTSYGGGGSTTRVFNWQDITGSVQQIQTSGVVDFQVCAISGAVRQGWPQVTFPYAITQEGTACNTTTTTAAPTTTTTTTAPTTTTTTTAPIYYYNVTRYSCFPCGVDATNLIASSPVSLVNNIYYNNGDGYVYYINYGTGAAFVDVDLTSSASDALCNLACSI